jgi:hypothetical protein
MAARDSSSCGWSSDTAPVKVTKEATDVRPSALSTPAGTRDSRNVGRECKLDDGNPVRAGQPITDEGGIAGGSEERDGGKAAAAKMMDELDEWDGVALGHEREDCYMR